MNDRLAMTGIGKRFPGDVHAVVGENGAGSGFPWGRDLHPPPEKCYT